MLWKAKDYLTFSVQSSLSVTSTLVTTYDNYNHNYVFKTNIKSPGLLDCEEEEEEDIIDETPNLSKIISSDVYDPNTLLLDKSQVNERIENQ